MSHAARLEEDQLLYEAKNNLMLMKTLDLKKHVSNKDVKPPLFS
jgi:hypothetical protein